MESVEQHILGSAEPLTPPQREAHLRELAEWRVAIAMAGRLFGHGRCIYLSIGPLLQTHIGLFAAPTERIALVLRHPVVDACCRTLVLTHSVVDACRPRR